MASTRSISYSGRYLLIALGTVCVVVLIGAVLLANAGPKPATVLIHPSWAMGYDSASALAADADVVLVGTPVAVASEGPDAETPETAATRFSLDVSRVLKGSAAKQIIVKQTGGRIGDVTQVVPDDPTFVIGQRYVLFLRRVSSGPYVGDYFVLGGPAGRFRVADDGAVTAIGSVEVPAGTTVDTLLAK
jgi:hypothetical protein